MIYHGSEKEGKKKDKKEGVEKKKEEGKHHQNINVV